MQEKLEVPTKPGIGCDERHPVQRIEDQRLALSPQRPAGRVVTIPERQFPLGDRNSLNLRVGDELPHRGTDVDAAELFDRPIRLARRERRTVVQQHRRSIVGRHQTLSEKDDRIHGADRSDERGDCDRRERAAGASRSEIGQRTRRPQLERRQHAASEDDKQQPAKVYADNSGQHPRRRARVAFENKRWRWNPVQLRIVAARWTLDHERRSCGNEGQLIRQLQRRQRDFVDDGITPIAQPHAGDGELACRARRIDANATVCPTRNMETPRFSGRTRANRDGGGLGPAQSVATVVKHLQGAVDGRIEINFDGVRAVRVQTNGENPQNRWVTSASVRVARRNQRWKT